MNFDLDHFEMALLFAAVSSIVLGLVTKRTDRERIRYGATCFGYFMLSLFGIGWLMHFLHG
jgi:hypothetical protein